ncbi:pantoate--beta-alanine ligase [Sphingobacterium corticibacter]|uniref:Pantothenate synthetase n=1 Tax=Sphingobacterium corticibacter TaxID=2171749 RepID=A0A2T8HHA7_9SPHI|nr:pantoate--beta-alanine ligase [Sphingobacterium corticibacter]PVH24811.1 pantoate--beta-alanine ligase [Sphingobacterium corticibacter]
MEIFVTASALKQHLATLQQQHKKIGFVPTMGALHDGHISLIQAAKAATDVVVCSIFVNPTQFNDPKDLEKYPRPIEHDKALLTAANCDILFLPEVNVMYPENDPHWEIDLGNLDQIWEGEHRPGHFQGVTQIVYKLFQLVNPDIAFFGQKDFQQVMVIQRMIAEKALSVKLHIVPTLRDAHGLALSSRNARLSPTGIEKAYAISKALRHIQHYSREKDVNTLIAEATALLHDVDGLELEYLAICETTTLEISTNIDPNKDYVVLVAAWLEGVRLIDNMLL